MKKTMTGLAIIASLALTGLFAGPALADDTPAATQEVASSPDSTSAAADSQTQPSTSTAVEPSSTPDQSAEPPSAASTETASPDTAPPDSGSSAEAMSSTPSSSATKPSVPTSDVSTTQQAVVPSPAGKGHAPVTICHQPGTPAQQTLTVDDNALKGHLKHGDTLGECAPLFKPYEVSVRWIIPASWPYATTPSYQAAIFPQTRGETIPCGQWSQDDVYLIDSAADEATLASLGDTLTMGEDSTIYKSHVFTQGEQCPPPTPGPANPAASIDASCGVAHLILTNDGENIPTASLVMYVDGDFYQAYAIAAGDHQQETISFGEDTGTHTVEVRTGPAFGDEQVAIREGIASDCEQTPATPPTDTPTTTPTPQVTPSAAPQAPLVAAEPVSEVTSKLADTGSKNELGAWPAAVAIIILILGLLFILFGRGKKKASK